MTDTRVQLAAALKQLRLHQGHSLAELIHRSGGPGLPIQLGSGKECVSPGRSSWTAS